MIPSDHFIYFYNEVFKFLQKQGPGALDLYYSRVADRQANFVLDTYRRDGLAGVRDYYHRIRIEENCDLDIDYSPECVRLRMNVCPSLSKALDSDGGACSVYCDHCPGWCMRVLASAGLWEVFDMISRTEPVCDEWIYTDRDLCLRKYREMVALRGPDLVRTNLDLKVPYITNRLSDSARFEYLGPNFKTAFGFLRTADLKSLPLGKVEIDGDRVFAYVSEPDLKPFGSGKCEAHRAYVDIHSPIAGPETIGMRTMRAEELALPFNEKDDYVLFDAKVEPLTLEPGEFVAFFPPIGGHSPGCTLGNDSRKNKKICVKVKVA